MEAEQKELREMSICRFCFNEDEKQLTNIYRKDPKIVPLPIQIMSCLSIEVFVNDGMPQLICNSCRLQTNQSYIFKSNCKKAQDAFKSYLKTGEFNKPQFQNVQIKKRTIAKISSSDKYTQKPSPESQEVQEVAKKPRIDDGTEVITLCISKDDGDIAETRKNVEELQRNENVEVEEIEEGNSSMEEVQETVEQIETSIFSCELCEKSFPLEQLLDLHISNHHNREKSFTCDICGNSFHNKSDLKRHQLVHSEKTICCKICNKKFYREALLAKHEATHEEASKYSCTGCDRVFVEKYKWEQHVQNHEEKQFSCSICSRTFVFKQGLERHMASTHNEDKRFKCDYCNLGFNSVIRLTRHVTSHAGMRPYPCKICKRTFYMGHHLTRHMRTHYENKIMSVGHYKCDLCSMSFMRKDSLVNHSVIHSMVNLKCVICETSFDSAEAVKEHITSHLQGLPFPCDKCDYSFDTQNQLEQHEMRHAEMEYEEEIENEFTSSSPIKIEITPESKYLVRSSGKIYLPQQVETYHIDDVANPNPNPVLISKSPVQESKLEHLFQSVMVEGESTTEEREQIRDVRIRPIERIEGTKMYERKGPINRTVPFVPANVEANMASIEEINERPPDRAPEGLSDLPAQQPVNVMMGDKMVKVQKFIVTKNKIKEMAKAGIIELRNGRVLMKGNQKIINAKMKPCDPSDMESLITQVSPLVENDGLFMNEN